MCSKEDSCRVVIPLNVLRPIYCLRAALSPTSILEGSNIFVHNVNTVATAAQCQRVCRGVLGKDVDSAQAYTWNGMCIDICADMGMDICIDMCKDTCTDMCIDVCIDIWYGVLGSGDGTSVGVIVGLSDGTSVGISDGAGLGSVVGIAVGVIVGMIVGRLVKHSLVGSQNSAAFACSAVMCTVPPAYCTSTLRLCVDMHARHV